MTRRISLLALAFLTTSTLAFAPAPIYREGSRKTDLERMCGVWVMESDSSQIMVISTTTLTCGQNGLFVYDFTANATKSPKEYDLVRRLRPVPKECGYYYGIYRLEADTLTFCYNKDRRPTDFVRSPGTHLAVHKRKKR